MSEVIRSILEKRETLCRRLMHYRDLKRQLDKGCTTPVCMSFAGCMVNYPLALSPDVTMMMIETTIRNLENEVKAVEIKISRIESIVKEEER